MKKSVWVVGGAGFVGANLVRYLLRKNYDVHVLGRSTSDYWRFKDISKKMSIHKDVLDSFTAINKLAKKTNPYFIFHLASYGAYPSQQDFSKMIATNIQGIVNLYEGLKGIPIKKLVVISSSSEYGRKFKKMKEDDILEPDNYYAITKSAQTHITQMLARMEAFSAVIVRLFNVYGPYEEKGRLVRNVIEACLKNEPIKLATGKESRDLIYVDDVCDILLKAAKSNKIGEIYNAGSGKMTTIYRLALLVKRLTKSKSDIMLNAYIGRGKWDSIFWKADISKSKKELDFAAKFSLKEGLIKTIRWYEKQPQKKNSN